MQKKIESSKELKTTGKKNEDETVLKKEKVQNVALKQCEKVSGKNNGMSEDRAERWKEYIF